ncbi:hypothetical protein QNH14_20115 [Apirhabdus apintestini]|nr:hypothetical protein QNH14_20115 [Enterobacteriaceae bacterium CA-0114]
MPLFERGTKTYPLVSPRKAPFTGSNGDSTASPSISASLRTVDVKSFLRLTLFAFCDRQ